MITGPSGSGKTLLLSTIAEAAEEHSSRVNFCFAGEYGAIFEGTLEENILLEQKCSSRSLTNSITNIFGLNEMNINSEGKNLSGGMKQRLLLARIYSQNPDLIILDNSFSALDPHSFNKITSYLLNDIWSKKTVIIASNDKRLEVFANQIFTIENGQIVKMHPKI